MYFGVAAAVGCCLASIMVVAYHEVPNWIEEVSEEYPAIGMGFIFFCRSANAILIIIVLTAFISVFILLV